MKRILILSILITNVAVMSCSKKKWAKTAEVSISSEVSSNVVVIAGKSFVMDTLLVDFSSMGIKGDRVQADDINISNSTQYQTNFITGSSLGSANFDVPQGTYDLMEMPISLGDFIADADPSNIGSTVRIKGEYFLPSGSNYQVDIALNITPFQLLKVLDNDNSQRVLIEEGSPRTIRLILNTEILFDDITPGLWNAAAVTSVNGSQTIQVSELNNQSIYYAILAGFPDAISAKFE